MITIHKSHTVADPFCRFPKTVSDDPDLSWGAKGILCYLLGKPDGWKTRVSDIVKHGKNGADAVRAALKELRAAGYVKLTRLTEKGKVIEWKWEVSDAPVFFERPDAENPHTEKPNMEKPDYNKKEGIKKECSKNEKAPSMIDTSYQAPKELTRREAKQATPQAKKPNPAIPPFPKDEQGIYDIIKTDPRYDANSLHIHNAVFSMFQSRGKTRGKPFYDWISALFARAKKIQDGVKKKQTKTFQH
jgi:hypothetical protein